MWNHTANGGVELVFMTPATAISRCSEDPLIMRSVYQIELPTIKNNKNIEVFDIAFGRLMKDTSRYNLGVYKGLKTIFKEQPDGDRVAGLAAYEECKSRKRFRNMQLVDSRYQFCF